MSYSRCIYSRSRNRSKSLSPWTPCEFKLEPHADSQKLCASIAAAQHGDKLYLIDSHRSSYARLVLTPLRARCG